jgi:DNA-binding GntR family transcriptional regulator
MAPGERIQEQKVTQALNVSRGSVREALLILERRHLVAILPRRGAHVTELDERSVRSLCSLMGEFYILLGNAVAQNGAPKPTCARFWKSSSACSVPMTNSTSRPSSPTALR